MHDKVVGLEKLIDILTAQTYEGYYIYPSGQPAQKLYKKIEKGMLNIGGGGITGFVDNRTERQGLILLGKPVLSYEQCDNKDNVLFILPTPHYTEILEKLDNGHKNYIIFDPALFYMNKEGTSTLEDKLYICGTGVSGIRIYSLIKAQAKILGFITKEKSKSYFLGLPTHFIKDVKNHNLNFYKIVFCSEDIDDYYELLKQEVPPEFIVLYNGESMKNILEKIKKLNKYFLNEVIVPQTNFSSKYFLVKGIRNYNYSQNLSLDYVRYQTVELLVKQIEKYNVQGEVAELGVFRGEFASYINRLFPDRKLYLFDTFEGFVEEQRNEDIDKGYLSNEFVDAFDPHAYTSVDLVMDNMPYKENCIIKKGFFPDSLQGLEEIFALVSIDVDLYEPIYEGLAYFYPRLVEGGYILIHDYDNVDFFGVRKAIEDYELKFNYLIKVPLCDEGGTIVIVKPFN